MTGIDITMMSERSFEEITVKQKIEWSKKTKVTASTKGEFKGWPRAQWIWNKKNYGFHKCTEKLLEDFE